MSKIKVKVFSDYACPWCYLGNATLNSLKNRYDFEVEHVPFELHPDMPVEGMCLSDFHPGDDQSAMEKMFDEKGRKYGITYGGMHTVINSRKALILSEYAESIGKGTEYSMAVWQAYFGEGRNLNDDDVLITAAAQAGIPAEDTKAALADPTYREMFDRSQEECAQYKISSVPTFVFDEKYQFSGAQPEKVFRQVFDKLKCN